MTIKKIISSNLCTGCGVCISEQNDPTLQMVWNEQGFYIPDLDKVNDTSKMERVCPFSLSNDKSLNEDSLAINFIESPLLSDSEIGLYTGLYAGYSVAHRQTSSSGGLATYVFEQLLKNKHVDNIFIVKEIDGRYAYQLINDPNNIKKISKTRYYPVNLASLFEVIEKIEGTVAVSGVACFIKAIRLKQHFNPSLKQKIPFLVGIICGGLKSKYYTDFLAQSSGCSEDYKNAEYRVKNDKSVALDYKFSCNSKSDNELYEVKMQSLGDMWGTGLFKSNACDFCDDVTTELADISLGDAWMHPYNNDGLGNNVAITRSAFADDLIKNGIDSGCLKLDRLDLSRIKQSQQGSFNHRHKGLLYRIKKAQSNGITLPEKRQRFLTKQHLLLNIIQYLRMTVRANSLNYWVQVRDVESFNIKMKPYLLLLKSITRLNNNLAKIKRIFKNKGL